jgi:hypothetical protein
MELKITAKVVKSPPEGGDTIAAIGHIHTPKDHQYDAQTSGIGGN